MKIELLRVRYMPSVLKPGVLYVSEEFFTAAHLCACGCGEKVTTPLGPTEWAFEETNGGPSLFPSIGSWQLPCRSHYWIRSGTILWSEQWTADQIAAGRRQEEAARASYFDTRTVRIHPLKQLWLWIKALFRGR